MSDEEKNEQMYEVRVFFREPSYVDISPLTETGLVTLKDAVGLEGRYYVMVEDGTFHVINGREIRNVIAKPIRETGGN